MPSQSLLLDCSRQIRRNQKKKQECVGFLHTGFFSKHKRFSLTTMKDVANNSIVFFPLLWLDTYIENHTILLDKPKPNQINSDSAPDLATFHNISLCVNHASKYMLQAGIHSQCHLYKQHDVLPLSTPR